MSNETEFIPELSWCPECQAPSNSEYAHVQYCDMHRPVAITGELDRLLDGSEYIFQGEGGDNNRVLLDFLHGRTRGNYNA